MIGRLLCAAAAALMVSAGAAHAQSHAAYSGNKVVIGVLTDLSGFYSDLSGKGSVEAAKMAVADFGGKVNGVPVTVISADHQNKPDIASAIARKWYDTEGVDAIVGLVNSGAGLAVRQVSREKGKIDINSGAGSTALTNAQCSPTGFHWAYDVYAMAVGTGNAVVKQGGKTWFFLTADYAFGHDLEKQTAKVVKADGGTVLGQVAHPQNSSDFSSYLLQAQASKAQIIGLANAGGDTINAIKQAKEFGITQGGQKLAGLLVFISDVHALGLKTAQGMLLTTSYYWDRDKASRAFAKRFAARMNGRMPTMVQAGVYSSVLHYLKAVAAAKTDQGLAVAREMRALPVHDFFAANGHVRADGLMVHDMYLAEVKSPAESKYPWDYYKILRTIPGDQAFMPLSASTCPLVRK